MARYAVAAELVSGSENDWTIIAFVGDDAEADGLSSKDLEVDTDAADFHKQAVTTALDWSEYTESDIVGQNLNVFPLAFRDETMVRLPS